MLKASTQPQAQGLQPLGLVALLQLGGVRNGLPVARRRLRDHYAQGILAVGQGQHVAG